MATWIKCTNTKHEAVYINLDNAVTVRRNDVADRIAERGTLMSFMDGEHVYIVVNEATRGDNSTEVIVNGNSAEALLHLRAFLDGLGMLSWSIVHETS